MAGALCAVLVAALVAVAVRVPPAFTSLADCARILPAAEFARVPGTEGLELSTVQTEYENREIPAKALAAQYCTTGEGGEATALSIRIALYSPELRGDRYAVLREHIAASRPETDGEGRGSTTITSSTAGSSGTEEHEADLVATDLPDIGDGGWTASYTAPDALGMEDWSAGHFSVRNVIVHVQYRGTPGMDPGERGEALRPVLETAAAAISEHFPEE
ncbi:hypothetical protein J0910_13900 [Nocardiopsis sp. CNT-189]|uniref:hypothetical protein n=1 Tax=Nocardiopsis oceanisediminis TaxID=2816862 RepID=UPI003B37DE82